MYAVKGESISNVNDCNGSGFHGGEKLVESGEGGASQQLWLWEEDRHVKSSSQDGVIIFANQAQVMTQKIT